MTKRLSGRTVDRRKFLTGVAIAGAATAVADLPNEAVAKAPAVPIITPKSSARVAAAAAKPK